jgi:N-sulfoglucosamine sulfohydrolase
MHNLAGDPKYVAIKTQLWEELRKTLTEQQDPRILGHGDVFDKYEYEGNRKNAWDTVMGSGSSEKNAAKKNGKAKSKKPR